MGKVQSKESKIKKARDDYVKMLKRLRFRYIRNSVIEREKDPAKYQLSFVSDVADDIDWKIFFEDYLEAHQDTCFWVGELLGYFKDGFFPNEKRWIDNMFYEQFTKTIMPIPDEIENQSGIDNFRISVLEEKMLCNVLRESTIEIPIPDPNDKEGAIVRYIARFIDKSLRRKDNPFNLLISKFQAIFLEHYQGKVKILLPLLDETEYSTYGETKEEPMPVGNSSDLLREMLVNIQYFIRLLIYSLSLFYKKLCGTEKVAMLRELVVNSIVDILLRHDMYDILFSIERVVNKDKEDTLTKIINKLSEIEPKDVDIKPVLCLDRSSPILEESKMGSSFLAEDHRELEENKLNSSLSGSMMEYGMRSIETRLNVPPYQKAIEKISEVPSLRSPNKKLQSVATLNQVICECIDNFWKGIQIDPEHLSIDADQYISILKYLIVKARIPYFFTHIALCNEFCNLSSKTYYNAYCLTTINACLEHLLSLLQRRSISFMTFSRLLQV